MTIKRKYNVYKREVVLAEGQSDIARPWRFIGSTIAASAQKAISNVRFRSYGKRRTNGFYEESIVGEWIAYDDWKAEEENNESL